MSEPVGNSPRGPSIPGNSHKDREVVELTKAEPREPVEKIIEGKVTTRKKSWLKRAARSMVADDAQSIGDYLMADIVVPAMKNLIREVVVGSTDHTLFGSGRHRPSGIIGIARNAQSLRTRYDQMSSIGEPRRMLSRESRARHDFSEVVLDSRSEAYDVIENMIARVQRYGATSVADLYDLVGVTGSFQDQRWGWTDLSTADVRQFRGSWLLDLPQPEPLR